MGSLLLTIRCLSIIHLVMAAPYPLTISQNQSLFCGCLSRKAEQRDSVHPSFKKDKNKGIPSVMSAFVTILACVCLLGCLPHSSASTYDKMPPLDIECKTVVFVEGAHHPMSRLVSVVVYRRPHRCRREYNNRCWCKRLCWRKGIETNLLHRTIC
jgi:hypothetical protein